MQCISIGEAADTRISKMLNLLYFALCVVLIVILFLYHIGYYEHTGYTLFSKVQKLRGPKTTLFFGVGVELFNKKEEDLLPWYSSLLKESRGFLAMWIFGLPFVSSDEPDYVEVLLNSKNNDKGFEYWYLQPWLNGGLLLSSGRKWFQRRKILTPSFHFKILGDNVSSIERNSKIFVDKMLANGSTPFNVEALVNSCTLEIICKTAMGFSLDSDIEESGEIIAATKRVKEAIFNRALSFYSRYWLFLLMPIGRRFKRDVKFLHDFTRKVIAKRRKELSTQRFDTVIEHEDDSIGYKKPQAFLDTLLTLDLSNKAKLTDADIQEEVDTFMFEGSDTTTIALTMAMYELGMNPDVQENAYKEQLEIFGTNQREMTRDDLSKMDYLEMVIKETLRMYPPVSYLSRRITEDIEMPDGSQVPKDTFFAVLPYAVHRNPKYFPDPERFDPLRFTPDECVKRNPFAYIPFSAGPRNCIGQKFAMMEMKVVLSHLLRNVKITSVTKRSAIKLSPMVVLRSLAPIIVSCEPR